MVARSLAKRVLPDPVVRQVQRRLAERAAPVGAQLDLAPLELLRNADLDELRDPAVLEHRILPELGLNDEILDEFPRSLYPWCGRGLRHWQYPGQFGPYLASLAGRGIRSYLEIGVRHGGTFLITLSYLERFAAGGQVRAVGCDVQDSPFLRAYARRHPGVRFARVNSRSEEFRELVEAEGPFDLALIDGDHSEAGCQADLELVRPHASIVVLHDITSGACPEVGRVWRRFKDSCAGEWDFAEHTAQYEDVLERMGSSYLGLGVATRRAPGTPAP